MDVAGTFSTIITLGIFVLAFGYLYERFIRGRMSKVEEERQKNRDKVVEHTNLIGLMQKQMDSMEALMKKQAEEMKTGNEQIIILRTQVEEKDKKLKEYIEIFQGRDPRMEAFMATASEYMKTTSVTILALQKWIDTQKTA